MRMENGLSSSSQHQHHHNISTTCVRSACVCETDAEIFCASCVCKTALCANHMCQTFCASKSCVTLVCDVGDDDEANLLKIIFIESILSKNGIINKTRGIINKSCGIINTFLRIIPHEMSIIPLCLFFSFVIYSPC